MSRKKPRPNKRAMKGVVGRKIARQKRDTDRMQKTVAAIGAARGGKP